MVLDQSDATAPSHPTFETIPVKLSPSQEAISEPRFVRVTENGERYVPHRFRDGMFRVADPALGRTKHHAGNQLAIKADEIADYLRKGFLLRMRGEISGQVNLIAASEIRTVI